MIKFKSIKNLPARQLFALYQAVDWIKEGVDIQKHGKLLAKVYANSDLVFSAWNGDKLIGVVRVITDKLAHAVIFGLAVDPQYQGQGVAKELLKKCFGKYPNVQWDVEAEPPAAEFLQKLGFRSPKNQYLIKGNNPI